MAKGRVVMGLLFFPRGGSAQVARYLSLALADADWSVELVSGSLGAPGEETHAPTFFEGVPLRHLDYSDAVATFEAGGNATTAPIPMHPSYEDRADAPDVLFAAVPEDAAGHLAAVWQEPFAAAGAAAADLFHLHHLTPQHDAVARHWPATPVLTHLHGTEIKFLQELESRADLASAVGTTLAGMPGWVRDNPDGLPTLDDAQHMLLRSTRWSEWIHGDAWRDRLRRQAQVADHLVALTPGDRADAIELLGVEPELVSGIPNGVDTNRFAPRPMTPTERRSHFRRWLVEDPQGWDESGAPGSVSYRESDIDRLLGPSDDAVVLIYVGRFTAAKRVPLLVRAFAQAESRFARPTSLVIWGGHPGEWEGEHPVTVARQIGAQGLYFAGWRGHDDLPQALRASDALVMPSVNDSFAQTALEAMATGLPVIATTSGGFPLMVNLDPVRPTGWLVPPDDESALAEGLIEAVNAPGEVPRRGEAALTHALANLSWSGRVTKFEEAYDQAVARCHRKPRDARGGRSPVNVTPGPDEIQST